MSKLSLFDKIGILLETMISSNLYIFACLIFIVLGIVLSTTNKKNEKRNKIFYISYTIFILVFILVSYNSSLGKMFSYMMNNFFIAIYFPNLAIYLAAIIVTNIILFISVFNYKITTSIKNLNITIFTIMNYLLLLILNTISKNGLDIFSKESIYNNKQCLALIELSSTIFIVWLLFLIIYRIILIYLKKEYRPKVKKVIVRKKIKKLPDNYQPLNIPDYVYGNIPSKQTHNVTNNQAISRELESRFTLEEYKLFSKILKEQKNEISIEKEKEVLKEELKHIDIIEDKEEFKTDFRNSQKQEIIKMEEERKALLKLAKEKELENEKTKEQEQDIPIKNESVFIDDNIRNESNYEIEDKEQAKLTELERLYQSIR